MVAFLGSRHGPKLGERSPRIFGPHWPSRPFSDLGFTDFRVFVWFGYFSIREWFNVRFKSKKGLRFGVLGYMCRKK